MPAEGLQVRWRRGEYMGKATFVAVGSGGLSAAAALAIFTGSPLGVILVYLAPLPLLLVGLSLGSGVLAIAAATGIVLTLVFGGFAAAGLYGGMHVIPAWLMVQQALTVRSDYPDGYAPAGRLVVSLALFVAFVMAVTALAGSSQSNGLEEQIRQTLMMVMTSVAPTLSEADRTTLVGEILPLFLGFAFLTWYGMILGNVVLAQRLLQWRGLAQRSTPVLSEIRLPDWYDWVVVAVAAVALVAEGDAAYIAHNTALVLLAPYFLVGLAVVHVGARATRAVNVVLTLFYVVLFVFSVAAGAAVMIIGILEQWIGLRQRLAARADRRSE